MIGRAVNLNGETWGVQRIASTYLPDYFDSQMVVHTATGCRSAPKRPRFSELPAHGRPVKTERHGATGACRSGSHSAKSPAAIPSIYTGKVQGVTVIPLTEEVVANIKSVLLTIFCAGRRCASLGCVNLAGISLKRAAARQRELAVRTALGATRGQLAPDRDCC